MCSSIEPILEVPDEEMRRVSVVTLHVSVETWHVDMASTLREAIVGGSTLGASVTGLVETALQHEKLELSVRTFARVLQAVVQGDREACARPPCVGSVNLAVYAMIRVASRSALEALKGGKLLSLGAFSLGGVVWVSGRIRKETLAELLGTKDLPVLLASERLSQSILEKAHCQDHRRAPQDISVWPGLWHLPGLPSG